MTEINATIRRERKSWGLITKGQTPFIFILIAAELFFFINGKAFFPDWDSSYSNLILVYLVMTVVFLAWAKGRTKNELKKSTAKSIGGFILCFFVTGAILLVISLFGLLGTPTLSPELLWPTIIVQVCVVATSEELMFRGVMLDMFGILISSLLFAIWHIYAYGVMFGQQLSLSSMNWGAVIFAFVMGVIFCFIAKNRHLGLAGSIGSHACYNLAVCGALFVMPSAISLLPTILR